MFCTQCGTELEPQDRHCCQCGKPTAEGSPPPATKRARRLTLSRRDKKIGGVCAGVAHYLGLDVTLTRIIWMILVIVPPGLGLISYLVAWLVMPKEQEIAEPMAQPSAVAQ